MNTVLPPLLESLRGQGWDQQQAPMIGIGQSWGGDHFKHGTIATPPTAFLATGRPQARVPIARFSSFSARSAAIGGADVRGRRRSALACGVVAAAVAACLTAGATTGAAAPPPPLPLVPGVPDASSEITPVAVPTAPPVEPKVEREPLTAPAPSPDSAGARQATSPDPLKMVAATWTGPSPKTVEMRSRLANGAFGPWTRVDLLSAEREGRPTPVSGTEPMWVAGSREVQVRAVEANGASATKRMTMTSIDPKTTVNDAAIPLATTTPSLPGVPGSKSVAGSASTSVPSAVGSSASPAGPKIVTRAQWGADEKSMTWAPEYTPTVRAVTIHHTAGTNDYTAADSAAIVRGIYAYHAKTQGWGDIGYHALVDRFGTIFEGRAGGLDKSIIAAHAAGFNKETFGVAIMGDLTNVAPNSAAMGGVARIAGWKLGGLYRDPKATVTLTSTGVGTSKYAAGKAVTLPTVFAHRDVGKTECPGNTGYRSMGTIRDRVAAAVGDLAANPIRTKWLALRSTLGEPSAVESDAANGGRVTRFQSSAIYWTAATRAWSVRGAILTHWNGLGAERSTYGYPRSDQYAVSGGTRQDFQNGSLFVANGSSTVRKA